MKTEEIKPKVWSHEEVFLSGKSAFRIGIDLSGNLFKGDKAETWIEGWKYEQAHTKYSTKRMEFFEDNNDRDNRSPRKSRPGAKSYVSRTDRHSNNRHQTSR